MKTSITEDIARLKYYAGMEEAFRQLQDMVTDSENKIQLMAKINKLTIAIHYLEEKVARQSKYINFSPINKQK